MDSSLERKIKISNSRELNKNWSCMLQKTHGVASIARKRSDSTHLSNLQFISRILYTVCKLVEISAEMKYSKKLGNL